MLLGMLVYTATAEELAELRAAHDARQPRGRPNASWLKRFEKWLSILARKVIRRVNCT